MRSGHANGTADIKDLINEEFDKKAIEETRDRIVPHVQDDVTLDTEADIKVKQDETSVEIEYTDDLDEDTGYKENKDSESLDVWTESISGHNWEIENFIQAAFVLSTNDLPDTMEQLLFQRGVKTISETGEKDSQKYDW